MIGPFLFSVKKQTLCTHNACTVSRENTIFHFRSIKIVSHLTHILKRKRADLDLAVFLFIIIIIIILLLKRPSTSCTFQFSLVLDCGTRNFNLSIKCQRSLINKNSNVWGYTEIDLQRVPELQRCKSIFGTKTVHTFNTTVASVHNGTS